MQREASHRPADTTERVVIFVSGGHRLEGDVHVPRMTRLIDILNHQTDLRPFMALTNVRWQFEGRETQHPFVSINRNHILLVVPLGE